MTLSPREYEVARLLALGWTGPRIASTLGIHLATVWRHRARAMEKAQVSTLYELWTALGWLRVPGGDVSARSIVAGTGREHSPSSGAALT